MIVDPDFLDHWKTRILVGLLDGDECAPLYVIRLWAHCQNRRQSTFENLSPEALKALCHFPGHSNKLDASLVASGFVRREGKCLIVVGWDEYNSSLIAAWNNGAKGGRPPKFSAKSTSETTQKKPTGLPMGIPTGNPRVSDKIGEDKSRKIYRDGPENSNLNLSEGMAAAWNRWKNHSSDKGKTIQGTSEETQLMRLGQAYPEEAERIAAIEYAILKNWANINLGGEHRRHAVSAMPTVRKVGKKDLFSKLSTKVQT